MLLSGIGKPYDPVSGQGRGRQELLVSDRRQGRRCSSRTRCSTASWAAAALATAIDEFNGDNFDHARPRLLRRRLSHRSRSTAARRSALTRCRRARRNGAAAGRKRWRSTTTARSQIIAARRLPELPPELSSISIRRIATPTACRSAHDVRLAARTSAGCPLSPRRRPRRSRKSSGPSRMSARTGHGEVQHRALPEHAQCRRRDHGRGSRDERRQQVSSVVGRAERVRDRRAARFRRTARTARPAPSARSPAGRRTTSRTAI